MVFYSWVLSVDGKRCVPLFRLGGASLSPDPAKGGLTMVTYSDLIQIGLLIVDLLSLLVLLNQAKK